MKRLFTALCVLFAAAPALAAGTFLPWNLNLGGQRQERANVQYCGVLHEVTDTTRLDDWGKSPRDNATVYSGQMLDLDGVGTYVDCGDIGNCSAVEITIYPATTTEPIIQLASGVTISINAGVTSTAGLTNVTTYVDGVAGSTVSADYHVFCLTFNAIDCNAVKIGTDGTNYYNGLAGNARLWDAKPSTANILFSYKNPETLPYIADSSTLTEADLKGWWPLIEGSGDTAYDWSGNGNNGTLTNFTLDAAWENAAALSDPHVLQTAFMAWGMGSNLAAVKSIARYTMSGGNDDIDGGINANKYLETIDTDNHKVAYTATHSDGAATSFQVMIKGIGRDDFQIRHYNSVDGTTTDFNVKLSTEENCTLIEDDWYLITATSTAPAGVTETWWYVYGCVSAAITNYTGDITKGLYVYGDVVAEGANGVGAVTFTSAAATNALTPIRTWETANQFTRDYNELNWNGKTKAQAITTIAKTVTLEAVININDVAALQYIIDGTYNLGTGYVKQTAGVISASSGTIYVNSVATTTIASGLCHVVVSGLALDLTHLDLMANNAGENQLIGQMPMFKLWYDVTWDAATVAKYYAKAAAKYGL